MFVHQQFENINGMSFGFGGMVGFIRWLFFRLGLILHACVKLRRWGLYLTVIVWHPAFGVGEVRI